MTYDEARAQYQQAYTHWRELQRQWVEAWDTGSPGIPLTVALSEAERALRAATGALHRATPNPARPWKAAPPTLRDPSDRWTDTAVHVLAATLAAVVSLYFTR